MTKLIPYQKEGVRAIYKFRGRALLADEQGLGKTIQAIEWIRRIPSHRPAIIVTPASLKWNWQAEAHAHFGIDTEVLDGFRPKRQMQVHGDIIVLNYDILASWLPALLRLRPPVVIFDEIHYLKDDGSQRTQASAKLAQFASSVVGLSGTPFTNHLIELWAPLSIIKPKLFPSKLQFAQRYTRIRWRYGRWQFRGAKRQKELHRILRQHVMIRRLKKDYLKDLPAKKYLVTSFKLKSYTEYNEAEKDIIKWLAKTSRARANKAKKSKALVRVGYLLRLAAKLKLRFTKQWIKDFHELHPDRKLICFTMNTYIIEELQKTFPKALVINGKVKGRKRFETVRRFQNHKASWLLLGQWKAAGVGLTLTAAQDVAGLDLPWAPGDLDQGMDRAHRIGQKKQVTFHFLIALQTIEEKLMKGLKERKKILDAILNGTKSGSDFDILEYLANTLYDRNDTNTAKHS